MIFQKSVKRVLNSGYFGQMSRKVIDTLFWKDYIKPKMGLVRVTEILHFLAGEARYGNDLVC